MMTRLILIFGLFAGAALAQMIDTSPRKANAGTTLPATCSVGQMFFKTDATAGQNIYGCTATNTWTVQGGAGSVTGICPITIVSSTTLRLASGCKVIHGGTVFTLGSNADVSSMSGSGSVRYVLTSDGNFLARHTLAGATCTNITCSSGGSVVVRGDTVLGESTITSGTPGTPAVYEFTKSAHPYTAGPNITLPETNPGEAVITGSGGGGGMADPGGNGVVVRTALNTTVNRTITGTTNDITVTNGDGVSGNINLALGANAVTASSTNTFTNKTEDTEATGNALQVPERREWLMAQCDGATGKLGPGWSSSATLAPTPTCTAGSTNTDLNTPTLRFPDSDGAYHVQRTWYVPNDWTANIGVDVRVWWSPVTSTSGNVVFTFRSICRAAGEARDVAFASTLGLPASASTGTAGQLVMASTAGQGISSWGTSKVCTVDFSRDRTNASDTFTGEVDVHLIEWTFRRIL